MRRKPIRQVLLDHSTFGGINRERRAGILADRFWELRHAVVEKTRGEARFEGLDLRIQFGPFLVELGIVRLRLGFFCRSRPTSFAAPEAPTYAGR